MPITSADTPKQLPDLWELFSQPQDLNLNDAQRLAIGPRPGVVTHVVACYQQQYDEAAIVHLAIGEDDPWGLHLSFQPETARRLAAALMAAADRASAFNAEHALAAEA